MPNNIGFVKALLEEPWDYLLEGFALAFLWQTFSYQLAGIYFILLVVDAFGWFILKPKLNFNSVSGNSGKALGLAVLAWAVFLVISFAVINFLQKAASLSFSEMLARMSGATFGAASQPILEANPWAIFIIGTVLIPKRETKTLIARMLEIFSTIFKVELNLKSITSWMLFGFVAAIGVIFHIQAKGMSTTTDFVALTLTFIFWMVSCFLIVKTQESESAVYLHMINNGWTLLDRLK